MSHLRSHSTVPVSAREVGRAGRRGSQDLGADDGTRTRDPHLGKAVEAVHLVLLKPFTWAFVRLVVRPGPLNPPCSRAVYFSNRAWFRSTRHVGTTW